MDKSCFSCKYFSQYYIRKRYFFNKVHNGVCSKRRILVKEQRHFPFSNGCEEWRQPDDSRINHLNEILFCISYIENYIFYIVNAIKESEEE